MEESLNKKEKFFESETKRFIEYFGLKNWEIEICRTESDDSRASCIARESFDGSLSDRLALIQYDKEWINSEIPYEEISRSAFHEVMEILLMVLRNYNKYRDKHLSYGTIDSEVHNIIRTLENTIYEDFLKPKIRKKNGNKKHRKSNS
ncbi:MAG: hypothetical protein GY853_01770 [PVC group bacterium]|nr:hypothetical protein [PVC group bacterium]